ncbi:MAG: hypothetical protein U0168_23125 [Nannocystaceae bacterium]
MIDDDARALATLAGDHTVALPMPADGAVDAVSLVLALLAHLDALAVRPGAIVSLVPPQPSAALAPAPPR